MFPRTAAAPLALLASSAVTLVAAQTTLTDVIAIPGFEGPNEASVISADASATVLVMKCPNGTDESDCGLGTGITATVGPSTWAWAFSSSDGGVSVSERIACSLDRGADTAVCTHAGIASVDATVTDADLMTTGTLAITTTLSSDISQFVWAVTVTGGLDKLQAAATATGTSVSETGSTRPTATGTGSSGGNATGTGASASATSTADRGNGGVSLKVGGVWMGVLGAAVAALL